jgi:NADH-quinone oxidoreductase subunit E
MNASATATAPLQARAAERQMHRKLDAIFKQYPREEASLIMVLQEVQEKLNWLPPEALDRVAEELKVPRARVQGVATFYRAFSLVPRGKKVIKVCLGTACHVRGASVLADELERQLRIKVASGCTDDGMFSLESVNCVGACAMAPVVVVGENYYANTTWDQLDTIIKKERQL